MFQLYQDEMIIVRNTVSLICSLPLRNPLWGDITSCLLPEQKATDQPDLIVRVFQPKLRELLYDILDGYHDIGVERIPLQ